MARFSPNTLGAIFMMLSMAGFVLNDTLMKLVLADIGLFQAIALRGVVGVALMIMLCVYMGAFRAGMPFFAVLRDRHVLLRSAGEAGGTYFFLTALNHMPIANVTAVLQLLPLTITLGAALLFGEKVGWRRYLAILIGFAGVMLIIRPGGADFNIFALYALIATFFVTMRDLVTRRMDKAVPSLLVSLITAMVITALGVIGSLFEPWQAVNGEQAMLLIGAAAILMVGYICSILAMRDGEVSFIAPFRYSILIWALVLGYFVFGDVPDLLESIGALIVVGSGLFTFYRERLLARKAAI